MSNIIYSSINIIICSYVIIICICYISKISYICYISYIIYINSNTLCSIQCIAC